MSVLNVPDDLLKRLGADNRDALVEIACRLYETSRLRFDEASRLADVTLEAFAAACALRKIPVYWYGVEDLDTDLAALHKMGL
jgi:predicted HTH domain antitoxin